MKVFPAIDLCNSKVVRLYNGDYDNKTIYNLDAVEVAKSFYNDGARYLHIVDLDGAKNGSTSTFSLIERVVVATGMYCEIGGGIRNIESIEKYISHGASRIVLGTVAICDPKLLEKAVSLYGDKVAVGVDTKEGKVAYNGWTKSTNINGVDFCKQLQTQGVKHVIYTDIEKDGALTGTNLEIYKELSAISGLKITASGGVTYLDEILKLNEYGIDSVILGKALYEGVLDLKTVIKGVGGNN